MEAGPTGFRVSAKTVPIIVDALGFYGVVMANKYRQMSTSKPADRGVDSLAKSVDRPAAPERQRAV